LILIYQCHWKILKVSLKAILININVRKNNFKNFQYKISIIFRILCKIKRRNIQNYCLLHP